MHRHRLTQLTAQQMSMLVLRGKFAVCTASWTGLMGSCRSAACTSMRLNQTQARWARLRCQDTYSLPCFQQRADLAAVHGHAQPLITVCVGHLQQNASGTQQ